MVDNIAKVDEHHIKYLRRGVESLQVHHPIITIQHYKVITPQPDPHSLVGHQKPPKRVRHPEIVHPHIPQKVIKPIYQQHQHQQNIVVTHYISPTPHNPLSHRVPKTQANLPNHHEHI